ncbi:MAG: hypothetical protein IPK66_18830 [Rhodospirillales bacterium]|nr:hypothetical protein [Rhodospirillales bacterium]
MDNPKVLTAVALIGMIFFTAAHDISAANNFGSAIATAIVHSSSTAADVGPIMPDTMLEGEGFVATLPTVSLPVAIATAASTAAGASGWLPIG